jgi:NHL repeat-containing protein
MNQKLVISSQPFALTGNINRRKYNQGYTTAIPSPGIDISRKFFSLTGLAINKQGNIYVADLSNHRIRKISPEIDG